MVIFNVVKNYLGSGVNVRVYESNTFFGDYYRVVVNLKLNHFEFYEIRDKKEYLCFTIEKPKFVLDLLGYKLVHFISYNNCEDFVSDFCDYIRREQPSFVHLKTVFANAHGLERFL